MTLRDVIDGLKQEEQIKKILDSNQLNPAVLKDIICAMTSCKTRKDIAQRLGISLKTVNFYLDTVNKLTESQYAAVGDYLLFKEYRGKSGKV